MSRDRKSQLDPHRGEIAELLAAGRTYGQIAEEMQAHFPDRDITWQSVAYFVKHRDLKSCVTQGSRNGRIYIPHCDSCKNCVEVLNTMGTSKVRVCMEKKCIVSRSCLTSPMDCPRRENVNENND